MFLTQNYHSLIVNGLVTEDSELLLVVHLRVENVNHEHANELLFRVDPEPGMRLFGQ